MATDQPPTSSFLIAILRTLEAIQAPYMIVGAFGSNLFGVNRVTYDVDVIVDLNEQHIQSLAATYPMPRYYADPEQMLDSIRSGIMFNIIDTERGEKADLVPLSSQSRDQRAFRRRVRLTLEPPDEEPFEIWCARPEDLIVGKLNAWNEGRSRKHSTDIHHMVVFQRLARDLADFDEEFIDQEAEALGDEVIELWDAIKLAAQRELDGEDQP